MKNLIKIICLFFFINSNTSDLLNNLTNNKETKITKFRKFFYLKKEEKEQLLKETELEKNLTKNILYQIAKNSEYRNPSIDLNNKMAEVHLFRKKKKPQKEIGINNIESNIESVINNKENNINDIVLNIKNNENEAQIEIEKNLNELEENVKNNENKFNKIIDIHNITENLAQLHIIGQSKAEKQAFENKIKHFITGALQIATLAGTVYITVHNLQK